MRVLLVSLYWPPAGGGGVQRPLKFATHLPAIRIVREEEIDVVLTTSPPGSVHLVGAAAKRATGVRWVADLRDSLVAHPHRRAEQLAVRAKEQGEHAVARLVARGADAVVAVSDAIAVEARGF